MAEYSDGDAEYARYVVNHLLSVEGGGLDIENDLVVYDLQHDTTDFYNDLKWLEDIRADVPAISIAGENVPMALSSFGGRFMNPMLLYPQPLDRGRVLKWLYNRLLWRGYKTISHEEARSTFALRATHFLATRIATIRAFNSLKQRSAPNLLNVPQKLGGVSVVTPGCHFSVSSNSPGLRVFWSGAYRISSNYFSHPTTPATSVLQSGTYVFGVDGGAYGNDIQWDERAVVSLPGIPQIHLNF